MENFFLAMLKGGHKRFWGSFYPVVRSFSHIEGGGRKKFLLFKEGGGREKFYLKGGGSFKPAIFKFCMTSLLWRCSKL